MELNSSAEPTPVPTPRPTDTESIAPSEVDPSRSETNLTERTDSIRDDAQSDGKVRRRTWFGQRRASKAASERSNASGSVKSMELELRDDEDDVHTPLKYQDQSSEYGLGDDARMGLG